MSNIDSLVAALEGNYEGMSHADLVLTCNMLHKGRETWRKEVEALLKRNAAMAQVLQSIIDGCVHPKTAVRAAMVNLTPIRDVLKQNQEPLG